MEKSATTIAMVPHEKFSVTRQSLSSVLAGTPDMFSSGAGGDVLRDLAAGRRNSGEILLPRILLDCPLPCLAARCC